MDKGVIFEKGFRGDPCQDGGFIVVERPTDLRRAVWEEADLRRWAFTSITDLLTWLAQQAEPKRVDDFVRAVRAGAAPAEATKNGSA